MNAADTKIWQQGREHGENAVYAQLIEKTNQFRFIKYKLWEKGWEYISATNNNLTVEEKEKYKLYMEGIRHCLNILENYGPPDEAYKNIINADLKIPTLL